MTATAMPGALNRESTPLARAFSTVLSTPADSTATIARLALGLMILPHGLQKTFGLFGGYGFDGTMGFFTDTLGIPALFAFLAIAAEFAGGLGLILGLTGRIAAFGVGSVMDVAALMNHVQNGFFMNWGGGMPAGAEGWEFHLLAVALAAIVIIRGSGSWSLDRVLGRKK